MSKNDGGPAFPHETVKIKDWSVTGHTVKDGMSLRDYFAAQAMPAVMEQYFKANGSCLGTEHAPRNCAAHAYTYADALLAEREK